MELKEDYIPLKNNLKELHSDGKRLLKWRIIIFTNLFILYVGYFFCRTNLTVASPFIAKQENMDKTKVGIIISFGTCFYVIGKLIFSPLVDLIFLAKRSLLIAGFGSVFATVLFSIFSDSFYLMILFWSLNRFVQSICWTAVMRAIADWFDFNEHGRIVGFMSVSYLFGDSLARIILGFFIRAGFSWQKSFILSALILFSLSIVTLFLMKNDPSEIGLQRSIQSETSLYKNNNQNNNTTLSTSYFSNLKKLYSPLFKSFPFYLILLISIGLTFIREVLRDWIPIYLQDSSQISPSLASITSSLEPFFGALSAITLGFLVDKKWNGKHRQGIIMSFFLVLLFISLIALCILNFSNQSVNIYISLLLLSIIGFSLTGPYSLSAKFSLQLGGKTAPATISALTDAIGYIGSISSGFITGKVAETENGWAKIFALLSLFAFLTTICTFVYYFFVEMKVEKEEEEGENIKEELIKKDLELEMYSLEFVEENKQTEDEKEDEN